MERGSSCPRRSVLKKVKMTMWSSGKSGVATCGLLALMLVLSMVPAGWVGGDVGLGHAFYGTVKLDGEDAAVGTVVSARVGGIEYGRDEVTNAGVYGLIVQGDIQEGAAIHFYVAGWEVDQEPVPFEDGLTTSDLDLTASTTTYALTMEADPEAGGIAADLTGDTVYLPDAEVEIGATANQGYRFTEWTAPAGEFLDRFMETTTFIMPHQHVTVTANFVPAYALNITANPQAGGTVDDLTNDPPYPAGTSVNITAVPKPGYMFGNWTSQPENIIHDPGAPQTFLVMPPADVNVTANFKLRPEVPTVTTNAATDITAFSARIGMTYTTGNFSAVDVRFVIRRARDVTWFPTPWVSRTEDGTYTLVMTDLSANTEYDFRAELRYNETVESGDIRRFITGGQTDILFPPFCFIATAAYGTPSAEQIDVLREFRDAVLIPSSVGSRLVALYYQLSPPVAEVISENGLLRTLTRELVVDPVVRIVEATGHLWRR